MSHLTVLKLVAAKQEAIEKALEAKKAYEGKEKFPQYAMALESLQNAVKDYVNTLVPLIQKNMLQSDPAGILTMSSVYGPEVDEIAKEYVNFTDNEQLAAVIKSAEKSFIQRVVIKTKAGLTFVLDKANKTISFIWNGVKTVYKWIADAAEKMANKIVDFFKKEEVEEVTA